MKCHFMSIDKKYVMSVVVVAFLLCFIIFFFLWKGLYKNKVQQSQTLLPASSVSDQNYHTNASISANGQNKSGDQTQSQPITIQYLSKELTERIQGAHSKESLSGKDQTPTITPSPEPTVLGVSGRGLSDGEIFNKLWPNSYRQYLDNLQNMMVQDKFITPEGKIVLVDSDSKVFIVLNKIVDYAVFKKWISPENALTLKDGATNVLPSIIAVERANMKAGIYQKQTMLPGDQHFDNTPSTKYRIFKNILDGLAYVLGAIPNANAQLTGIGSTAAVPGVGGDCYKNFLDGNPIIGFNGWDFCCNCGLICTPFGCAFVSDCGPGGSACDLPLGCLNLICGAWPNSIWDPQTGICGCG